MFFPLYVSDDRDPRFDVRPLKRGTETRVGQTIVASFQDPAYALYARLFGPESRICERLAREANQPGAFRAEHNLLQLLGHKPVFGPNKPGVAVVSVRPYP